MVDFDGNGRIDGADIGVSIAMDMIDEESEYKKSYGNGSGGGCLTTIVMVTCIIAALAAVTV